MESHDIYTLKDLECILTFSSKFINNGIKITFRNEHGTEIKTSTIIDTDYDDNKILHIVYNMLSDNNLNGINNVLSDAIKNKDGTNEFYLKIKVIIDKIKNMLKLPYKNIQIAQFSCNMNQSIDEIKNIRIIFI
jgi:hypothetical protein